MKSYVRTNSISAADCRRLAVLVSGLLLALLNISFLAVMQEPWGISSVIAHWGAGIVKLSGSHPENWRYFQQGHDLSPSGFLFPGADDTWLILGLVAGSLLSALLASEFRWKKIRQPRQIILAVTGGALMGLGARLADGCNVGAFFSAVSSLSLHGWIFAVFTLAGTYAGIKLLTRLYL